MTSAWQRRVNVILQQLQEQPRYRAIARGASRSRFLSVAVVRIPSSVRDDHVAFKMLAWE
jgi:hypothetical protein